MFINKGENIIIEPELLGKIFDTATTLSDNSVQQVPLVTDPGLVIVAGPDGIGKSTLSKLLAIDIANTGIPALRRKVNWGMEETPEDKALMDIAHNPLSHPVEQSNAFAILAQQSFLRAAAIDRPGITVFDRGDERFYGWGLNLMHRALLGAPQVREILRYFEQLTHYPHSFGWKMSVMQDLRQIEGGSEAVTSFVSTMLGAEKREEHLRSGTVTNYSAPLFRLQVFCSPEETWSRLTSRAKDSEYDPQTIDEVNTQIFIQNYADRRIAQIPVFGETTTLLIDNSGDIEETKHNSALLAHFISDVIGNRSLLSSFPASSRITIKK